MVVEEVLERLHGCVDGALLPDEEMCRDAAEVIEMLLNMAQAVRREVPRELYRQALDTFGADAQTLMVFEEMAELQDALCKLERGRGTVDQVAEEIADVQIMLEQMTLLHGCAGEVDRVRSGKLSRLQEKLEEIAWKRALRKSREPAENGLFVQKAVGSCGEVKNVEVRQTEKDCSIRARTASADIKLTFRGCQLCMSQDGAIGMYHWETDKFIRFDIPAEMVGIVDLDMRKCQEPTAPADGGCGEVSGHV